MGNCQAVDAAALVIQHPCGKLERMYWPITARDVMKTNPGHYVSLIIPLTLPDNDGGGDNRTVRFTRVKLLRPTDKLVLGRAYRLVTSQDVMKVVRAKKHAKMKRNISESAESEAGQTASESKHEVLIDVRPLISPNIYVEINGGNINFRVRKFEAEEGPNRGGRLYRAYLRLESPIIKIIATRLGYQLKY